MTQVELTDDHMRVLEGLAALIEEGRVPTTHAVAGRLNVSMIRIWPVLDDLRRKGLITPSLQLTEQGRTTLSGQPTP